jgi:serine phosphatase RsbU (regulator of sigma subunit)
MRTVLPILLFVITTAAAGQDFIGVPYRECVWHSGDDIRWAAPNLDESGWKPYTQWKPEGDDDPRLWVRCRADIFQLAPRPNEAIQIRLYSAYEVYLDGEKIGSAGDLRSGNFSMDAVRIFPVSRSLPRTHQPTIALRITHRAFFRWWPPAGTVRSLEIQMGDENALRVRRTSVAAAQASTLLVSTICYGIAGVIGLVLLALSLYGGRRELTLLALFCLSVLSLYLNYFWGASFLDYPAVEYVLMLSAAATLAYIARMLFYFAAGKRRVSILFWILILLGIAEYPLPVLAMVLPTQEALVVYAVRHWVDPIAALARIAGNTAPFYVFWPYTRLEPRMRPIAALCMVFGAVGVFFFAVSLVGTDAVGLDSIRQHWSTSMSRVQAFSTLALIISLLALIFHDQQQTAEDRAILAGEMQAASEIQRMLAPEIVRTAPGVQIEVAFHPMREVGGDFFLCPVLPDGRQRLLLGDVSGKGAAAAMTAAMLLGGAQARENDTPAELLCHLNRVLRESHVGGFATCLCADLADDGSLVIANAGHLAPYYKGEELALPSNLPLGLDEADAPYEGGRFTLTHGDVLTFLSDGVVEARDSEGALFGFDRARALSAQSARAIAETAKRFGQQDDITVVRLAFAPDSVLQP